MFHGVSSFAISFLYLALNILALDTWNNTLPSTQNTTNFSVEPALASFLNATELHSLQKPIPQEQIEWINATLDGPWYSDRELQQNNRRTKSVRRELVRRYVDVTRCSDSQRRVMLRKQVRDILQMILDARQELSVTHPVWRALISPAFRDESRALERMKALFKVLFDFIMDSQDTVTLNCNVGIPQCLRTRKAPGDGRQQVPGAYFSLDENVVNLCSGFFRLPELEDMECKKGTPMSYYGAMRE